MALFSVAVEILLTVAKQLCSHFGSVDTKVVTTNGRLPAHRAKFAKRGKCIPIFLV